MRGFKRNTIQVKGAEKFFQRENRQLEKARRRAARRANGRTRRFVYLVVTLLIVAGSIAFIAGQQAQIAKSRTLRDAEVESLHSHVATLSEKLEESEREVRTLRDSISELERRVETERAERARVETLLRNRATAKRKLIEGSGG